MYRFILLSICCMLCWTSAQAHPGVGIVMDSKGNVFYTDLNHVWKITPRGDCSIAVRNVHTHELYLDQQDNLYGEHEWYEGEATDKWGNYVWRLTSDGVFEKTIPDVEGFLDNNTLVRDPDGNSYYADKSGKMDILNKQTVSGEKSLYTIHRFDDIRWMRFSNHDKCLYVVDHLKLKKVTPSGTVTIIADDLKETKSPFSRVAERHYIFGMWTDQENAVYIAVYGAGKVKKITANGVVSTIFKSQRGWSPCSGLIAPDGSLWIMEFSWRNRTRVRKITPDGKRTLYGS